MRSLLPLVGALLMLVASGAGAGEFLAHSSIRFDDPAQGRTLLTSRDEFVERLSPFDRAARLKSDHAVTEREYLDFVGSNVPPWGKGEQHAVEAALQRIRPGLAQLNPPLPATVELIETSGREEGQAAYTRGRAIILPRNLIASSTPEELARIIAHEFFHVASRQDAALRDKLYAVIGFEKCNEVELPAALIGRRITNPDAPRNDHRIQVRLNGENRWVVPVLYASSANYDTARGGEFFDYLEFRLLLVQPSGAAGQWAPLLRNGEPVLESPQQVEGFFEQVGRNTDYIIHPEEILADNFALLVTGKTGVPSPQILDGMRRVLSSGGTTIPASSASKNPG
jgi:hypothetical protein